MFALICYPHNPEYATRVFADALFINDISNLPFWLTELDPPRIKMGFTAYFPLPSADIGGTKLSPSGFRLYKPMYGAVRATGRVEASSYEMLEGI